MNKYIPIITLICVVILGVYVIGDGRAARESYQPEQEIDESGCSDSEQPEREIEIDETSERDHYESSLPIPQDWREVLEDKEREVLSLGIEIEEQEDIPNITYCKRYYPLLGIEECWLIVKDITE